MSNKESEGNSLYSLHCTSEPESEDQIKILKARVEKLEKLVDFIYSLDTIQYHSQYKRSS